MATVRKGNKSVLLVVDVQVGVMSEAWDAPRIINNVSRVVERARAQSVPVIWVQHSDKEDLPHGSPKWQWVPELAPQGRAVDPQEFQLSSEQTASKRAVGSARPTPLAGATNW
jgi:nicotinamidase-related amidase